MSVRPLGPWNDGIIAAVRTVIAIHSPDDPRVAPYFALKDRDVARSGDRFIAEGEHVVRRLLRSDYPADSVLLSARRVDEIAPLVPDLVPVYVAATDDILHATIGFKFHSGVIACGRRKPSTTLEQVAAGGDDPARRLMLMILPEVANAENLGALMRIAAGFGVDALVLGERSCDPFYRQAIRVSMGTVFSLPIVRSNNLLEDLRRLRERWGVQLAATVLDPAAEPLSGARRPPRFGLLFGNEAQGLAPEHVAACDRRVTIPMKLGTDSLNVAVAAGIFLYHFSTSENVVTDGSK